MLHPLHLNYIIKIKSYFLPCTENNVFFTTSSLIHLINYLSRLHIKRNFKLSPNITNKQLCKQGPIKENIQKQKQNMKNKIHFR